jgi:uncharacterized protein YceK
MKTAQILKLTALAAAVTLAGCSTSASVTKPGEGSSPSTAESRHAVDASYQETLDRIYATPRAAVSSSPRRVACWCSRA